MTSSSTGLGNPYGVTLFTVLTPSGSELHLQTQEEASWYESRRDRYQSDNMFCLPASALVGTSQGPIPINQVQAGMSVWAVDPADGMVARRIQAVSRAATQPIIVVKTMNRVLRGSPDHPVLVRRAVCRNPGAKPTGRRWRHELAWIPLRAIARGDILCVQALAPDVGGDWAPTRVVTEEFAEFAGLWLADGTMAHGYLAITHKFGAAHMPHYWDTISQLFINRHGDAVPPQRPGPSTARTVFSSVDAVREMIELGLCGLQPVRTVPSWVFGLSRKLKLAFLRGFIDGDGHVNKAGRITFQSSSESLARQLRHLAIDAGIPVTNLYEKTVKQTRTPIGAIYANFKVWHFMASDPGANREIGSNDPVDSAALSQGQAWSRKRYLYPDKYGRALDPPVGCGYAKVSEIWVEPAEPTFDLQVDGGNFIADGVVVHNTNISDLQDLDRLLMLEVLSYRWGLWMAQGFDYLYARVDENQLKSNLKEYSVEVRLVKNSLGIDKTTRDKDKGSSLADYTETLLERAKQFGYHRNQQYELAVTLFYELRSMVMTFDRCDDEERAILDLSLQSIFEWVRDKVIVNWDEMSAAFRREQSIWIKSM